MNPSAHIWIFSFSFQEAVLSALGAFPEQIPAGTSRSSIILKYPCRDLDGSVSWAGLRAARESSDLWMSLMADGGRIPAVGVFLNQKMANDSQIDNTMSTVTGLPLKMQFNIGEGLKWVGGVETSFVAAPPSYEVCILSFG